MLVVLWVEVSMFGGGGGGGGINLITSYGVWRFRSKFFSFS